jgi:hypothetical protein
MMELGLPDVLASSPPPEYKWVAILVALANLCIQLLSMVFSFIGKIAKFVQSCRSQTKAVRNELWLEPIVVPYCFNPSIKFAANSLQVFHQKVHGKVVEKATDQQLRIELAAFKRELSKLKVSYLLVGAEHAETYHGMIAAVHQLEDDVVTLVGEIWAASAAGQTMDSAQASAKFSSFVKNYLETIVAALANRYKGF